MTYLQIYIGQTPDRPEQRRALRTFAMDLRLRLRPTREQSPALVLLNAPVLGAGIIDLILVRPNAFIVGAVRSYDGPIVAESWAAWRDQRGAVLTDDGMAPLRYIGMQRDTLRARLVEALAPDSPEIRALPRMIAALISSPTLHPESRIALDIEDHRMQRKLLGLDELAGLAMLGNVGVHIPETNLAPLIELIGGQLWHDGSRLLFELAPPRLHLRLINSSSLRPALPLIEGENVIGRRRTARPHEHRLTIAGDDLMSSDHALVTCQFDGRVTLRDISKNGTWFTLPGGEESFVHADERQIAPGTILRMGETRMAIEEIEG
jgi:hypothetical protein